MYQLSLTDSPGASKVNGSVVKAPPLNVGATGDVGSIPGSGRSSGVGNGNPPQYSCQGNPMDCSSWGPKESDMTEHASYATPPQIHTI